ncbi:MAG: FMN-binding protein [Desulfobacteraceae bacterium]
MSETMSKQNTRKNSVVFALALSVVCGLLITAAATGLRDRQQRNMALDKRFNILKAARIMEKKEQLPADEINRLYHRRISEILVGPAGKILDTPSPEAMRLYLFKTGKTVEGYIVPITTRGLWGKIQGYLAFENDGSTIAGFSVFSHSETPGLGGEIETQRFQENFQGKKIVNSSNEFVSVAIARGKVKNLPQEKKAHYVDGISGATLTGKYLSRGIKASLEQYEPVSVTFRSKKNRAYSQEE